MKDWPLLMGLACVLLLGCSRASTDVAEREIVVQIKDDIVRFPDRGDCLKPLPYFAPEGDKARLSIPLAHFRKAGPCKLSLEATAADNVEVSVDVPKRADVAFARCAKNAYEIKKKASAKGENIIFPEIVVGDDGDASLLPYYDDTDRRCLMDADGTIGLVLHAPNGAELNFPNQTVKVPDSGEITVAIDLMAWLARLPLAALNAKSVAEAAKLGTFTVSLEASLDGDKHSRSLKLSMPYVVRPKAKYQALDSLVEAALTARTKALASAYIRGLTAASKTEKAGVAKTSGDSSAAGSALLLIGDDVISHGQAALVGAARIAIAESSKTEKLPLCGPYQLSGGADAFQNQYISHSLVERRIVALDPNGRRIGEKTFRPEPSCPSRAVVPELDVHEGFMDATPHSAIFEWMAGLK